MNERHALVLKLRREEHLTFREIGARLGVGAPRANAMYHEAERQERKAAYRQRWWQLPIGVGLTEMTVQEMNAVLSPGLALRLRRAGLTLATAIALPESDLRRVPRLGPVSVAEIRAVAQIRGGA